MLQAAVEDELFLNDLAVPELVELESLSEADSHPIHLQAAIVFLGLRGQKDT